MHSLAASGLVRAAFNELLAGKMAEYRHSAGELKDANLDQTSGKGSESAQRAIMIERENAQP
jgi:hypothetical protein